MRQNYLPPCPFIIFVRKIFSYYKYLISLHCQSTTNHTKTHTKQIKVVNLRLIKTIQMKRNGETKRRRNVAEEAEHGGDPAMWEDLDRNFRQVQSVLDRNRSLIQQVNDNHQSRMADNMSKNVALIQELNGNISKVVSMYSDLNTNFSSAFHGGRNGRDGGGNTGTRAN